MTFLLLSLTLSACKPDVPKAPGLPSNLNTQLTVTNGEVHVLATADSVNFYTVTFYDNNDTITVETQDGEATHIFNTSGTYKIRTRAHSLQTAFIEKTEEVLIEIATGNTGAPTTGFISPLTYPNYTLVWQDEFNGASLSSDWTYDIGTGSWGWGNNELQYCKQENAVVSDGILTITAKNENFNTSNYTSSRIKTQGIKSWKFGRVDVRCASIRTRYLACHLDARRQHYYNRLAIVWRNRHHGAHRWRRRQRSHHTRHRTLEQRWRSCAIRRQQNASIRKVCRFLPRLFNNLGCQLYSLVARQRRVSFCRYQPSRNG